MALKKALIERALGGELSHHLGYPPAACDGEAGDRECGGVDAGGVAGGSGGVGLGVELRYVRCTPHVKTQRFYVSISNDFL